MNVPSYDALLDRDRLIKVVREFPITGSILLHMAGQDNGGHLSQIKVA